MNTSMYVMYAGLSANLHLKWITCLKYSNVVHQFVCMHTYPCICIQYNVYNMLGIQYGVPSFQVVKKYTKISDHRCVSIWKVKNKFSVSFSKAIKFLIQTSIMCVAGWLVGWLVSQCNILRFVIFAVI